MWNDIIDQIEFEIQIVGYSEISELHLTKDVNHSDFQEFLNSKNYNWKFVSAMQAKAEEKSGWYYKIDKMSRIKALAWWNNLSLLQKTQFCDTNQQLIVGSSRRHETLTGSEIEKLYKLNNMYTQKEMTDLYGAAVENAPIAKKFTKIFARPAVEGEIIATVTGDGKETTNVAKAGDMVGRNQTAAKEEYIIPAAKFPNLYEVDENYLNEIDEGTYVWTEYTPKGVVHALEVTEANFPGNFVAPWGQEMTCNIGDFLCCPINKNEIYRIARAEFFETYKFI